MYYACELGVSISMKWSRSGFMHFMCISCECLIDRASSDGTKLSEEANQAVKARTFDSWQVITDDKNSLPHCATAVVCTKVYVKFWILPHFTFNIDTKTQS
mmetsp:Transcript_32519/g.47759  ORF Transcript_32519/g.47759 Transcript_32519/m.47759 type:complete len:101 (+) Transcript_32519:1867-2169(+)